MQAVDLQDKLCLRRIWGWRAGGTQLFFSAGAPASLPTGHPCVWVAEASSLGGVYHSNGFLCVLLCTHTCTRTGAHARGSWASLAGRLLSQQPSPCGVCEVRVLTHYTDGEAEACDACVQVGAWLTLSSHWVPEQTHVWEGWAWARTGSGEDTQPTLQRRPR